MPLQVLIYASHLLLNGNGCFDGIPSVLGLFIILKDNHQAIPGGFVNITVVQVDVIQEA
jgi:hypothetical protein